LHPLLRPHPSRRSRCSCCSCSAGVSRWVSRWVSCCWRAHERMVLSTSQQVALAFTAVLFTFVVLPRIFGVGGTGAKETRFDPRYSKHGRVALVAEGRGYAAVRVPVHDIRMCLFCPRHHVVQQVYFTTEDTVYGRGSQGSCSTHRRDV